MKQDAAARKFDRLLVWKVSRLGRDMREVIATVYELADLGVTVIPIESQTGPISSTMGKLLWAIQAWYAEMENSEKSGVAEGVTALVLAVAVTNGFHNTLERNLLGAMAHLNIMPQRHPELGIEAWYALSARIREVPGVVVVSPSLYEATTLIGGLEQRGIELKGIEVPNEHRG